MTARILQMPVTALIAAFTLLAAATTPLCAQAPAAPTVVNKGLPSVSPDGLLIAFVASGAGTAAELRVVRADGSEERRVPQAPAPGDEISWSPDGARLIYATFQSQENEDSLRFVSVGLDGSVATPVRVIAKRSPRLAPDGSRHAYPAGASNVSWSPEGRRFAYVMRDSANRNARLWIVGADGAGLRELGNFADSTGQPGWLRWSADGKSIALQAGISGRNNPGGPTAHIYMVDVASGKARKLAPHAPGSLDETPSLFPDGTRVAFQSNRTGRMEIWVMNADGTAVRRVTR